MEVWEQRFRFQNENTDYGIESYLVEEIRDIVHSIVDNNPAVFVCVFLGHISQCVKFISSGHFSILKYITFRGELFLTIKLMELKLRMKMTGSIGQPIRLLDY